MKHQPLFVVIFAICYTCFITSAAVVASSTTGRVGAKATVSTTTELPPLVAANATELPETELTTIIEIEETDNNSSESLDFINLPGYGVIDEANSTGNASQFTCYNRRYGYYADIEKNCYMFHLCYPIQEPSSGELIFQRFSFVCSDNATFDQQNLVCVDNGTLSYPCADSEKYFIESNDKLIDSMQESGDAPGAGSLPPQLPGATAITGSAEGSGDDASSVAASGDSAVAESAESPLAADADPNATVAEAEAARQYALLEQLFG